VTVDHVADLLAAVVTDPPPEGTEMLAPDPATPGLTELVTGIAAAVGHPDVSMAIARPVEAGAQR
jgi:hypothetical protein